MISILIQMLLLCILIKKMVEEGTFEFIIRVKGMLGNTIPILALIENGTKQDIFSVIEGRSV